MCSVLQLNQTIQITLTVQSIILDANSGDAQLLVYQDHTYIYSPGLTEIPVSGQLDLESAPNGLSFPCRLPIYSQNIDVCIRSQLPSHV